MKKAFVIPVLYFVVLLLTAFQSAGNSDLWKLFAKTRFTEKLNRELSMYFLYPSFPQDLKSLEGREVELTGFHIPLELANPNMLILSKFPMAECFFCGGAGPESVAVVYLTGKPPRRLKLDEVITVKGKLLLNEKNVDELNFVITGASVISTK